MSKKAFITFLLIFYLFPIFLFYLPNPYVQEIHECHLLNNLVFLFSRYSLFLYSVLSLMGLVVLLYKLFSLFLRNRKFKLFINSNSNVAFLDGEYYYLLNADIPMAFTFGFFSEKIILTEGLLKALNKSELKAVLLHEKGHIVCKHNIKKFFYNILISPFCLLTFFKKFYTIAIETMELEADSYALKMGISPDLLSNAILKVKSLNNSPTISYFGLMDRVEFIYSNCKVEYSYKDAIKGFVCLILPWVLLFINLFSSANACIVNQKIMNKKMLKIS